MPETVVFSDAYVWTFMGQLAILFIAILVGNVLRTWVPFLKKLYIPAAIIGGFLVLGLKQTVKGLSLGDGQRLIVATVGLADPAEPQNRAHIRAALQKQLPPELSERAVLFHLRGGIDYAVLSPRHRAMMAAMCFSLRRKPARQRSAEDQRSCADKICWERSAFNQSGRWASDRVQGSVIQTR